jgi:DNA modification methylase
MSEAEAEKKAVIFIPVKDVIVKDRARKEFSQEGLSKLEEAICTNIGLLHPILILKDNSLLTGERRLRVISSLHETGTNISFAGSIIPIGTIPAIRIENDFDALDLLIAEDVENGAREAFTWQEQAALVTNIARLKQLKLNAARALLTAPSVEESELDDDWDDEEDEYEDGEPIRKHRPTINHMLGLLTSENKLKITTEAAKAASMELHGRDDAGYLHRVQANLKLDDAMQDPEMAAKLNKAPTQKEALKILQVEERRILQGRVAHNQGKEFRGDRHVAIHGDCIIEMSKLADASIDICLVDPIYGINAHKFGVAKRDTGFHTYDDTPEEFERILPLCIKEVSRILKHAAHIYMFCDHTKFYQLKGWLEEHGTKSNPWHVQSFPLHYIKVNGSRCPVPGYTFRKTVEYIIFAWRGQKQSHHQMDSHFEVTTKRTEINGAAKEPDALKLLLNNSCYPGDTVLDFMAGSGSTMVACDELKLKCTSIESDKSEYGRIVERTKALKK